MMLEQKNDHAWKEKDEKWEDMLRRERKLKLSRRYAGEKADSDPKFRITDYE